ncbi:hypothetical protein GC176_12330 [bacterium]|nr:hypothetical protein [bacterium]
MSQRCSICSVRLTVAVCLLSLGVAGSTSAETKIGFRQVTIVEPVAIQRGTSQEMTLRSNFTLDETYATFFNRPGVTMTFAETEPKEAPRNGRGSDGTPFRFDVTASADALPGVRELRVATKQAVSSVSHLLVTDFPVVRENEKQANDDRTSAMPVTLPAAICGRVEKAEDVDFYSFEGKRGQQITADLYAQRVTEGIHGMVVRGPLIYLMDGLLTLYGPNGQVIAQNDNFIGGDPFLSAELPEDGTYCIEVRDARYAGSGRYAYCLEVASQTHAHAVFPLAVQRGSTTPAIAIGAMLGESSATELTATADETPGIRRQRLKLASGDTNPVEVLVSDAPQIAGTAEYDSIEHALPVELPIGISGRFEQEDATRVFSFVAQKDQWFEFEVTAHQLGLPTDPVLEIFHADGKLAVESDDGPQTKDPKLHWKAPSDGTFYVTIRDLHGRGGERFLYHLSMKRGEPDFEVTGEYYYAQIAPGTHMIWFAKVNRLNGYDGPVEIFVENLPPGVTAEPVTVPPGMTHCGIILSAADDAKIDAALVRTSGRATIQRNDGSDRSVVHYGRVTCEQQGSGGGQARWPISTQLVGVTKPLDLLKVEAEPREVTLKPGDKAEINVRIERQEGFTDPVTLAMSFDYFTTKFGEQLPPGVTVGKASKLRLAGKTLAGTVVLEASDKALAVEKLPIAVLARVSITFSITTNYASNPILLTVTPPPSGP